MTLSNQKLDFFIFLLLSIFLNKLMNSKLFRFHLEVLRSALQLGQHERF